MIATMHAFPPLHALSSRSWFLVLIVLLHLGFFWVLTNGLSIGSVEWDPPAVLVAVPEPPKPAPAPRDPIDPATVKLAYVPQPAVPMPKPVEEDVASIRQVTEEPQLVIPLQTDGPGSAVPVIVEPQIDPRVGLSEPAYPSAEIRAQHEGTVLLSVQVLANGRIGEVRIERSSGYPRLDDSAIREARRWRLIPGTRDGAPVEMWKRIPVTFQLRD